VNLGGKFEGQLGGASSQNGGEGTKATNGSSSHNESPMPASVSLLDPSDTYSVGPTSVDGQYGYNFTLQVNNQYHEPLTTPESSVLEDIDDPTNRTISNPHYRDTVRGGKFNDFVGVARNGPGTTPQSQGHDVSTQSFTIKFNGKYYKISTKFQHEITVVNGVITSTDRVIVP
jgi:hypothetical protein